MFFPAIASTLRENLQVDVGSESGTRSMDRISFRYLGVADVCWFLRLKRGVTRIFWKVSWLEPWIWMLLDADVFQEVTRFDCYFICANSQLGKLVCLLFLHWWMVLSLWLFVYFVPWIFLLIWVVKNHQVDWSYRSCILLLGKLYIYNFFWGRKAFKLPLFYIVLYLI